ncbi:MAG: T9SS type A sorting domain-containing protein [Bacteroidia bacterium]
MRKIIYIILFCFFTFNTKAQIIAGDSTSINVQYSNIPETNCGAMTQIDLDNDGAKDILFYLDAEEVGHTSLYNYDYMGQALQNNVQFFITSGGDCDSSSLNSVISINLNWGSGIASGYGRSLAYYDGQDGTWTGTFASPKDNFMGFRIIYPTDTAYGWILIGPYADSIKSFAIQKLITGMKHVTANNTQLSIYPNPTQNILQVSITCSNEINSIQIIDVLGKEILRTNENTIDVSSLQEGIYFVSVKTSEGILTKKIIVQR